METQKSISCNMTLVGKTILIEFKTLTGSEQETLEYAERFYENLKTRFHQVQNQDVTMINQQN